MPELVTADEVRRLRGERSRAAFAKELGVTAHTVYRWEQPATSRHARRPSGVQLELLRQRAAPPTAGADTALDADAVRALGAIERILDGDWRAGEATALTLLAADPGTSRAARALAGTGVALVEALFRADARRAVAALAPTRGELASLPPAAAAYAEAALALAHALPSGPLFDVRRVQSHVVRAAGLARAGDGAIAGLLCLAESNAALLMGDEEALLRAFARIDDHGGSTGAAIIDLHVEQLRSLEATLRGQSGAPTERLERLLADPRLASCPPLEARTCAMLALRRLDELGDPESAIALARKSRAIAARLEPGVHTAIAMRAEADALLRAGRLAEVAAVLDEADRTFADCGLPLTVVLTCQARYYLFTGQAGALDALAARLRAVANPSLRATCEAFAASLDAMASLTRVDDAEIALPRFARAEELAMGWSLLRRDVLLSRINATVIHGSRDEARAMLRRAQRLADRLPSAWFTAHLRRLEGTLLVLAGRWREGRAAALAAAGMFELAGDRLDAAMARFGVAAVERHLGEPGAEQREVVARAALDELGVGVPAFLAAALARVAESKTPAPDSGDGRGTEALLVALERLSAPGTTPPVVLRELVQVVARQVPGRAVVVDELDSDGQIRHVAGDGDAGGDGVEAFEFGDGLGRRLRLGVARPLAEADRAAVRLIALAGAMALEIASLRGLGHAWAGPTDEAPEIPGLIAVSPAMRRLRGDVARLAGSRATVVITGESGTGKEVLARAIHDRSPRAGQPYVAFNCAAVPHDLFESQLFGFRRGAFTGAASDQPGVVRAAGGGTLFLDEIGELPLEVQPKLLRFLENGEVFPIGAQRPVQVDVRVLAATHRDLADLVRHGHFREDLYYRLQVVPLRIPPLRERRDDIPALARHFARLLAPAGATPVFAPDALAALTGHGWPGNVRELRNVIERVLAYAPPPDVITAAHLAFQ
jgi:hypothetical protein